MAERREVTTTVCPECGFVVVGDLACECPQCRVRRERESVGRRGIWLWFGVASCALAMATPALGGAASAVGGPFAPLIPPILCLCGVAGGIGEIVFRGHRGCAAMLIVGALGLLAAYAVLMAAMVRAVGECLMIKS